MPGRPRFGRTVLSTAVVLAALSTAVGCGGGDPSTNATRLDDIEAVGTATLFPGTGEEQGEDINFPSAAVGEPSAVDVEVRNTTDKPMKVNEVDASGAEVTDDKCSGETVPSGEACTFRMVERPDGDGTGETALRKLTVDTSVGSLSVGMRVGPPENGDGETTPAESPTPTDDTSEPTDGPATPTEERTEPTDGKTTPPDVTDGPTDGPPDTTEVPEDGLTDAPDAS